jgi:hypothetical protein
MNRILFFALFVSLFLITESSYSQKSDYPTHFFIGGFTRTTVNDTTKEMWDLVNDNELIGKTVYVYSEGSFMSETMRLVYINGKLNYCATILEQDPNNPQGEICFALKSYKDYVFTFENVNHDFPKRIIYNFSNWRIITARVEDDTSGYDLEYTRDYNLLLTYTMKGIFLKLPFENKIGEIVDEVYDYYLEVQGVNYFIKMRDNTIKKEKVDKVLNKEVKVSFMIKDGLWDADDNNYQSRIGKYVTVFEIYE